MPAPPGRVETGGLASTYSRGIAVLDDTLYLSNATGPFATESRLYSAPITGGQLTPVADGLPDAVPGMIDTRMVAARNNTLALASRAGHVWARPRGSRHLDPTRSLAAQTSPASPSSDPNERASARSVPTESERPRGTAPS